MKHIAGVITEGTTRVHLWEPFLCTEKGFLKGKDGVFYYVFTLGAALT